MNVADSAIEVHREQDPSAGAYRSITVVGAGGTLAARSVPGLTIDGAWLFR